MVAAPTASRPREDPSAGAAPAACVWCDAALGPQAPRLAGRRLCTSCGAQTTDPWPTPAELEAAYARYRPESGRFSGAGDALLRRTRGLLARRLDDRAPAGPVLDVGAGDGSLLDALHARGRAATGVERDAHDRPDVAAGDVTDLDGTWSAVVLWHALEHLPAPGAAVDHAASLLAPGGLLVVAAPDVSSLQARAFGGRWLHLDLPRHLVHLPAATLVARLEALGLEVERVSHWRGGQLVFGWLHGLVGRLPGAPDLYDAIRRPEARSAPLTPRRRAGLLAAATALLPVAAAATALEVALGRGGTVEVEARRRA